jgi:formylglycine-generating enzyme required for sulfatase activity
MKLFISYSRDDRTFIYDFAKKLNDAVQMDVWIDTKLKGAQKWWETILNSIEACECFVYIMTPKSIASIYCTAEVDYALALNKPILPLVLKSIPSIPKKLQAYQLEDITNLTLPEVLLRCSVAIHEIQIDLLQNPRPAATAERPAMPEPKRDNPEHVVEVFAAAEESAAEGNLSLAEDLFRKVIEVDPGNLGVAAQERLDQLRQEAAMRQTYERIQELVQKGLVPGARALWKHYAQNYGTDHDPDNYGAILGTPEGAGAGAAAVTTPPPPGVLVMPTVPANAPTASPSQATPTPAPAASVSPAPPTPRPFAPPAPLATKSAGAEGMVLVPAGPFIFGNGEQRDLPAFHVDSYPVTNAQYKDFVRATGARAPWKGGYNAAKANHPVTGITYEEAEAFARWANKRLPTAPEWEKAARGQDGRAFPWGNQFDPLRCNTADSPTSAKGTTPVSAYPHGVSVYGAHDMAGNVWEWTSDEAETRGLLRSGGKKVLKGGSWKMPQGSARCNASSSANTAEGRDDIGFRCVRDA